MRVVYIGDCGMTERWNINMYIMGIYTVSSVACNFFSVIPSKISIGYARPHTADADVHPRIAPNLEKKIDELYWVT